jgi:hypothetical protein
MLHHCAAIAAVWYMCIARDSLLAGALVEVNSSTWVFIGIDAAVLLLLLLPRKLHCPASPLCTVLQSLDAVAAMRRRVTPLMESTASTSSKAQQALKMHSSTLTNSSGLQDMLCAAIRAWREDSSSTYTLLLL